MLVKFIVYNVYSCKSIVSLFCILWKKIYVFIIIYVFLVFNGKYWSVVDNDMVMLDGDGFILFIVEFKGNLKLIIKVLNGNFFKME